ncbi:MAG: S1C family serine protease [Candidatus Promineifilaceae bacterium]
MTAMRPHITVFGLALLALASLACGFSLGRQPEATAPPAVTVVVPNAEPATLPPPAESPPLPAANIPAGALGLEQALITLYALANPSVVHILVYPSAASVTPLGSGSGFIFDQEGHIVTNNHVVEGGELLEVIFAGGGRQHAEIIGRDVDSDLAVLQVESLPEGVRPVTLGDSNQLQVGELVAAIGNPFGEQGSMSLGIVSGLGRSLESQREIEEGLGGRYSLPEVIQTDAPINPGNSGGPLLNMNGEVVGVNSAIRSSTGVNSGVGFSIPVNAVRRIVPTLIANGSYIYSYMGVSLQSLNLNLQERFDLPRLAGAYVSGITAGSPAEAAGLIAANPNDGRGGDLIVAIDGQPIRDTEGLIAYLVFNTEVGQTIQLSVIRSGETITVPLTLGARP